MTCRLGFHRKLEESLGPERTVRDEAGYTGYRCLYIVGLQAEVGPLATRQQQWRAGDLCAGFAVRPRVACCHQRVAWWQYMSRVFASPARLMRIVEVSCRACVLQAHGARGCGGVLTWLARERNRQSTLSGLHVGVPKQARSEQMGTRIRSSQAP